MDKREFTVLEGTEMEDKRRRRIAAIYDSDLAVSRDPQCGYQATWPAFVAASRPSANRRECEGGDAIVDYEVDNLVDILWPVVQPIINDSSLNMIGMLRTLGVSSDEMSTFAKVFRSREELLDAYTDCFSGSRVFAAAASSEATTAEDIIVEDEDNDEDAMTSVMNSGGTQRLEETIEAALNDDDNNG